MRLFLCSHFSYVGSAVEKQVAGKKVLFIPTASIHEEHRGYVDSARTVFKNAGAFLTELDISSEEFSKIKTLFDDADVIYFSGGNSFFLIDCLRKTGTDMLLKRQPGKGKLFIGESAGAIVCAPTISYIEKMDPIPEDYSQSDYAGLKLIDFYVLPHYLCAPFKEASEHIMQAFATLEICALNNSQAVIVEDDKRTVISVLSTKPHGR